MNPFIDQFEAMNSHSEISQEEEIELVEHLFASFKYNSSDNYCRTHISTDDAAGIAFANPTVCSDYFELEGIEPDLIADCVLPKDLAHYLAFEQPDKATELFNELLYYHKVGRI